MKKISAKILATVVLSIMFNLSLMVNPLKKVHAQGKNYAFLVAGHAYGRHEGKNLGLYPKLIEFLKKEPLERLTFIIFAGDTVRRSTPAAWQRVRKEMSDLKIQSFFVMGNHDKSPAAEELFKQLFGNTYYSFDLGREKFIMLDSQKTWGTIPADQLAYLEQHLEGSRDFDNIFIFFHELIWTAHHNHYHHIQHNFGSYNGYFRSNFWGEVFPLLEKYPDKNIYIITGDVAGNAGSIPAYYEKRGHITFIATGMGAVQDENILMVYIKDRQVHFELTPLNKTNHVRPLEDYTPDNLHADALLPRD